MAEEKKEEVYTPEKQPVSDGSEVKVDDTKEVKPLVPRNKNMTAEEAQYYFDTAVDSAPPSARESLVKAILSYPEYKGKVHYAQHQKIHYATEKRIEVDKKAEAVLEQNQKLWAKALTGMDYDKFKEQLIAMEYQDSGVSDKGLQAAMSAPRYQQQLEAYKTLDHMILTNAMSAVGGIADALGGSQGKYKSSQSARSAVMDAGTAYTTMRKDQRDALNLSIAQKNVEIYNNYRGDIIKQAQIYDKAFNEIEKAHMVQRANTISTYASFYQKGHELSSLEKRAAIKNKVDVVKEQYSDIQKRDTAKLGAAQSQLRSDTTIATKNAQIANDAEKQKQASLMNAYKARVLAQKEMIKIAQEDAMYTQAKIMKRLYLPQDQQNLVQGFTSTVYSDGASSQHHLSVLDKFSKIPEKHYTRLRPAAINRGAKIVNAINSKYLGGHIFYEPDTVKNVLRAGVVLADMGVNVSPDVLVNLDSWDISKLEQSMADLSTTFGKDFDDTAKALKEANSKLTYKKEGKEYNKLAVVANYASALKALIRKKYLTDRDGNVIRRNLTPSQEKELSIILHNQNLINEVVGSDAVKDLKDNEYIAVMAWHDAEIQLAQNVKNDIDGARSGSDELGLDKPMEENARKEEEEKARAEYEKLKELEKDKLELENKANKSKKDKLDIEKKEMEIKKLKAEMPQEEEEDEGRGFVSRALIGGLLWD